MSPYCSWFVSLMFQTPSLTVSYLSHRCLQICLLSCVCAQTLSKHILLWCLSWSEPCSKSTQFLLVHACYSHVQTPRCLVSVLFWARSCSGQTLIRFLPGVWVQTCILLASPRVSCRSPAHSSLRPVPVLFRICSIYLPWKKWEQRSI